MSDVYVLKSTPRRAMAPFNSGLMLLLVGVEDAAASSATLSSASPALPVGDGSASKSRALAISR